MSKRRQSRIAVPFHLNRTGETVDANARRHLRVLNRRLSTHRVSGGETEIVRHVRENARFSQPRKTPTAVSRVIEVAKTRSDEHGERTAIEGARSAARAKSTLAAC